MHVHVSVVIIVRWSENLLRFAFVIYIHIYIWRIWVMGRGGWLCLYVSFYIHKMAKNLQCESFKKFNSTSFTSVFFFLAWMLKKFSGAGGEETKEVRFCHSKNPSCRSAFRMILSAVVVAIVSKVPFLVLFSLFKKVITRTIFGSTLTWVYRVSYDFSNFKMFVVWIQDWIEYEFHAYFFIYFQTIIYFLKCVTHPVVPTVPKTHLGKKIFSKLETAQVTTFHSTPSIPFSVHS